MDKQSFHLVEFVFLPFEDKIGRSTRHLIDGLATYRTRGIHSEIGGDTGLDNES